MAISFSLSLSPLQIEFLQALELYAEGDAEASILWSTPAFNRWGITWARKLQREGLVEHVPPTRERCHDPDFRAYRITDKGRRVLALIDDDVTAFIARQKEIRAARKRREKKGA